MEHATVFSDELLLTSETARELEVSRGTVVAWDQKGILRAAVKTANGTRLFKRSDVERLKREREAKQAAG